MTDHKKELDDLLATFEPIAQPEGLEGRSPQATVLRSMWNFASLFPERMNAVSHLMLTIGNGYDWNKGELVSLFDHSEVVVAWNDFGPWIKDDDWYADKYGYNLDMITHIYNQRRNLMEIYNRNGWKDQRSLRFPLLSTASKKYSQMWNTPDDITPAWLGLVYEALAFFEPILAEERRIVGVMDQEFWWVQK